MKTYDQDKLYDFPTALCAFRDGFKIIDDLCRGQLQFIKEENGEKSFINYIAYYSFITSLSEPRFKIISNKKKVKFYPQLLKNDEGDFFVTCDSDYKCRTTEEAIKMMENESKMGFNSYKFVRLITDIPELIEEREVDE